MMKKLILSLMIAMGSLVSLNASAENGYYVGFQLGVNNAETATVSSNLSNLVKVNGGISFENSLHSGLSFGYQVDKMRYEVEYQYGQLTVDGASLGAVSKDFSESGSYQNLMLNAYYTHEFSSQITGFVGAGIGWGKTKLPNLKLTSSCNCIAESNGYDAVYQVKIGAEYEMQKNNFVGIQYNWLKLPKPSNINTNIDLDKIQAISMGYRKSF